MEEKLGIILFRTEALQWVISSYSLLVNQPPGGFSSMEALDCLVCQIGFKKIPKKVEKNLNVLEYYNFRPNKTCFTSQMFVLCFRLSSFPKALREQYLLASAI